MNIGMIGAGAVALGVGRYAVAAGHQVVLNSRSGGERLASAVEKLGKGAAGGSIEEVLACDIVVLAVPWKNVEDVLRSLPPWHGQVLVDATNPFVETEPKLVLADLGCRGASEVIAGLSPGARIVKAFNSIVMKNFEAGPTRDGARRVLLVSGDDAAAKLQVSDLINSFGFITIDLGGLKTGGRLQQAGGPVAGLDLMVAG
jgi:predicted dinucleotide-binding enzyme